MTETNVQPIPSNSQHHDTPLLFAPSGANYEQGLGQARPNKITSEMQTHCRSKVPVEHNIFKN